MGVYIIRYKYPRPLWQGLVMEPEDRREAMRRSASSVGVDIKEVWYALGPWDVYWIVEAPSNVEPLAFRIFDLSQGFVPEMEVIPLLTVEEAITAMQKVKDSIIDDPNGEIGAHAEGWPPRAESS